MGPTGTWKTFKSPRLPDAYRDHHDLPRKLLSPFQADLRKVKRDGDVRFHRRAARRPGRGVNPRWQVDRHLRNLRAVYHRDRRGVRLPHDPFFHARPEDRDDDYLAFREHPRALGKPGGVRRDMERSLGASERAPVLPRLLAPDLLGTGEEDHVHAATCRDVSRRDHPIPAVVSPSA